MNASRPIVFLVSYPYQQNPQLRKETEALLKAGFAVHVVAWDRQGTRPAEEIESGIGITNIHSAGTFSQGGLRQMLRTALFWVKAVAALRRQNGIAIQCQDLNTVLPGLIAARLLRVPVIFDAHDPYPEMFATSQPRSIVAAMRWFERLLARRADHIITVNQLMAERFRRIVSTPALVLYNYPELALFDSAVGHASAENDGLVVGRIGTIQPGTGIEEMVEAVQQLAPHLQVRLLLVGQASPTYQPDFDRLIAPLRERVELAGFVAPTEVGRFYQKMAVSVMLYQPTPIFRYLSPMKLFESMAMGVPVIASDTGEIRQVVEKYRCGLVLQENSSAALAEALRRIAGDPAASKEMGENGRRAIREGLNWETESEKLIRFYRELLSARR